MKKRDIALAEVAKLQDACCKFMASKPYRIFETLRGALRMQLGKNTVNVFMALLRSCAPQYSRKNFSSVIVTYPRLAEMSGVCRNTLLKHLNILKARNLVAIVPAPSRPKNIGKKSDYGIERKLTINRENLNRLLRKAMKDNDMDGFFIDMDNIVRDNPDKEWPKVADTYAFVKSVADDAQTIEDLRPNERAFSEPRFGLASKALKRFQNHLAMLRSGNFIKTMQLEDECKNLPSDIVEKLSHPLTDAEIHDMLLKAMRNCVASKNHEEYDFPCNRDAYKTQSLYQFVYDNGDFTGKPKTVRSWFLYWLGHEPKKATAAHDAEVCRKVPDWFMDEQWSNGYASHCMYRNHVASIVEWYGLRKGRLVYTNSTDLACLSDFLKEVKGWTVNYNQGYLPRPTQKKTSKWMEFIHWMNEHSSLQLKTKEWAEKNVGQNSNRG